jgi:hypothetical protein
MAGNPIEEGSASIMEAEPLEICSQPESGNKRRNEK